MSGVRAGFLGMGARQTELFFLHSARGLGAAAVDRRHMRCYISFNGEI